MVFSLIIWNALNTLSPVKHLIRINNKAQAKLPHQQPARVHRSQLFWTTCAKSTDHQNEPETINSQMSDSTTITQSSPSQTIGMDNGNEFSNGTNPKNFADKECQTMDGVFLSTNDYETLLKRATFCPNFRNDLIKIKSHISNLPQLEMDPIAFERICKEVGAENLYHCIKDAICSD